MNHPQQKTGLGPSIGVSELGPRPTPQDTGDNRFRRHPGAVVPGSSQRTAPPEKPFCTGINAVDDLLGGGLWPGRIAEIFGPESSGKTSLALQLIASVQRQGGTCAFIDAEHALNLSYAESLGVQVAELLVCQPASGEQALGVVEELLSSSAACFVVVDSVAALTPQVELERPLGESEPGAQAKMMSIGLRRLSSAAGRSRGTVLFLNQVRTRLGVTFGSQETTPGGRALRFYASTRLEVRRLSTTSKGGEVKGLRIRLHLIKSRTTMPFRKADVPFTLGAGFGDPTMASGMARGTRDDNKDLRLGCADACVEKHR